MMAARAAQASTKRAPLRNRRGDRAFIVEALVLFIFLVASLSIVCALLFASASRAVQASELERAVAVASNVAERFSANPLDPALTTDPATIDEDLEVSCVVMPQRLEKGTYYRATITVSSADGQIYAIDTARYVSEVR